MRALPFCLVFVVSCASSTEQTTPIGKTDTMETLRALGALGPPVRAEHRLLAAIPERASAPLRVGEGNAWLEVTPSGMHDIPGAVIDGATVYRGAADDIDLVYVRDEGRVEELRLARSKSAAAHVSWSLRKGPDIATVQIVDGRIEAVDQRAIVRLRTEPAYAIDSNGTRRALQLELHGSTVDARLDVTGLVAPIAIDPAWVAAAAPSGIARVDTPLAVLSSGKVLLAGGQILTTGARLSTAEVYDPATNTWTATANTMAGPRAEHTVTHHGGTSKKVVLIGGYGANDLSTVEVYDETTNSFGSLQTMPATTVGSTMGLITSSDRRDHAAVRLSDRRILVIGGRFGSLYLNTMFLVTDGVVASTTLAAKTPDPIGGSGAVLLTDGTVLVISGTSSDGGGERYMRRTFTVSIAGTAATVTPRAELPVARLRSIGFVATVGPNKDRAMFVGGAITSATSERTLVTSQGGVMYDAAANTWLPLPLMATKRYLGAGGLLPGGKFLISGGASDLVISGNANQDAELLDLATMTWKSAGKMLEPRGGHNSAVLNDGSVLFEGGVRAINDGFLTLTTGAERFTLQASAATCFADGECTSGFCADGVCCDKACGGQCEACDITGSMGTCKPVVGEPRGKREKCRFDATSDPGCGVACNGTNTTACQYPSTTASCSSDACVAGRETHASTCDGAGKCKDAPKACGDYACDTKTCKSACTTKADCTNAAHFCEAGKCIPQQANGSACTREDACASGLCVDGTCCESKCDGQCQACDVPGQAGKCTAIKGKPHGARSDCEKDSKDACKSKSCDGTNTAACAGTVGPCANYACDDINKSCKRVCAADLDCGSGFQCDPGAGNCVPRTSRCVGNGEIQSADGTKAKCNAFICRDGACLDKCTSTNDCQNGFICDGAGVCTPTARQGSGDAGGCAMGTTGTSLPGMAAFLIALGLLRRRTGTRAASVSERVSSR